MAWYALDEGDNDPVRFWNYFVAAVQRHIPDYGETALAMLQPAQPAPVQTLVAQLVNELVFHDQPLVIVLDDYHLIQNPAIHEALTYLLDNQPPSLVMVIVSRSDPPMPLARWRSRRQLVELRASDLRFSIEESGELLNGVMGLSVSADDLAVLDGQTEGWAAGLQLAALALQARLAQGITAGGGSLQLRAPVLGQQPLHPGLPGGRSARPAAGRDARFPAANLHSGAAVQRLMR